MDGANCLPILERCLLIRPGWLVTRASRTKQKQSKLWPVSFYLCSWFLHVAVDQHRVAPICFYRMSS